MLSESNSSPGSNITGTGNIIYVFYTRLAACWNMNSYQQYLALLPAELQKKNIRFRRWEDRLLNLYGKILLMRGLQHFYNEACSLHQLQYTAYNRPYIPGTIDFNIAHSEEYVLCAIGNHVRLGVDIEKIRRIELNEFESCMSPHQWSVINDSPDRSRTFIAWWTWKEAVIKADRRGMSLSLPDIAISGTTATCDSKLWFLHNLEIDREYSACLALDTNEANIHIEYHQL
jgi:4'-phosphopantetheinyl transferase